MRLPYVGPWLCVLSIAALAACGSAERSIDGDEPGRPSEGVLGDTSASAASGA